LINHVYLSADDTSLPNVFDSIDLRKTIQLQSIEIELWGAMSVFALHTQRLPRLISSIMASPSSFQLQFWVRDVLNIKEIPWTPIGDAFDQNSDLESTQITIETRRLGRSSLPSYSYVEEEISRLMPGDVWKRVRLLVAE